MTSDGSPLARFRRSIEVRSVTQAEMAMREIAQDHFEDAIAVNERMGARPWLANTQQEYARMLLARDAPGGRDRAQELRNTVKDRLHKHARRPGSAIERVSRGRYRHR